MIVIDANVAVWAVLPVRARADTVGRFVAWGHEGTRLIAPMHWLAECVSAIRRAVYAGAVSELQGRTAIDDLFDLDVETLPLDVPLCRSAFDWAARLRQARTYDAFYLALAEEQGAEFWTADERLANAARQAGATWAHWIGEGGAAA